MRVRIDAVHLTLRGYAPPEARELADALPAAVAAALEHPDRAAAGAAGQAGQAVAAVIRAQAGPRTEVDR